MKDKFIRIVQPLSLAFMIITSLAAALLLVLAIKRITNVITFVTVAYLVIVLSVLIISVRSIFQSLKNGVDFKKDGFTFTGLDDNNKYCYSDIIKAEAVKDTKASLKKKYVQRYSNIILYLKDDTVATIELGFTTKKKLETVLNEINSRIE